MWTLLRHWFARPGWLWLLLLLPVLAVLALWAARRRRRALAVLGGGTAFEGSLGRRKRLFSWRGYALASGLFSLVVAAAGPRWGREWGRSAAQGRDLVVVLDLSRSMLAEKPSRLQRARRAVLGLCDAVETQGGHRIALVVFAAHARLVCPLTHDYDHFREVVLDFDDQHLDPALAADEQSPSGTRLGEALVLAVEAHGEQSYAGAQDVLLISDGDDPAGDDEWRRGVAAARLRDVPVHVVGVGDPAESAEVPGGDGIKSRLEEKPLETIARATGGLYVPMHTSDYPLGEFLSRFTAGGRVEYVEDALPDYQQRYAWFLAPALGFLALSMVLGEGRRRMYP